MLALRQATEGLVVVFSHGCGDYLRGGEYRSRTLDETVEIERFLTRSDLEAFAGKAVFCMSCDSNGLAQASLDAGALAFVGFDEIAFNRFSSSGDPIGSHTLVKHCQELLFAPAVKAALERFVTGRSTLDGAVDYMRLWLCKNSVGYVRTYHSVRERREVAALALRMKDGLSYHGPSGIRFTIES